MLTTQEAAGRLGLAHDTVTKLCTAGRIKAQRRGGIYLIRARELTRFERIRRPRGRPKKRSAD